ncbi:uncharacterized protein C8Q71DRAFT_860202 [Rhodofomes roseus]|uniref:CFEM domain-containing protein n=1 Tax=Rhodofomes roseus TaxID=34475 RepID=A0ABQ8K7X4_9APHY|nr:uncharacterized protein C8Q71DRAFT_860202 [Rhodofomes roseus]KAH9833408.1 hypothetical protein C8Q71DRAFT_860202 [Rhodofomes roseus]
MHGSMIILLAIASAALRAVAQSSVPAATSYPTDSCIFGCVTEAASTAGCLIYTNLPCVCASETYQNAATSCLQSKCTPAQAALAQTIQQDQCAYVSAISSLSSEASTFTAAASSVYISDSSAASSISSAYSSYGSYLSSKYSAYGASLSSDYSSLGSSLSVLFDGASPTTGSGAASTTSTSSSTTANAGSSLWVDATLRSAVVACIITMLGIVLGMSMVL